MNYLLAISLGPVQEFIAAARRTADLQAGSSLLVELAKCVARVAQAEGANRLIFPGDLAAGGPNKILVKVRQSDAEAVADLAARAQQAAQDFLERVWRDAVGEMRGKEKYLDHDLAATQIARFLEFYAAWVPLADENAYNDARIAVDRLLAGRKALRQFEQCDETRDETRQGRPKSPLDPSRDCALAMDRLHVPAACRRYPLWLKNNETLDAISLLKRIRGVTANSATPSTSYMAAKAILPELRHNKPEAVAKLEELVKKAGRGVDLGDFMFDGRLDDLEAQTEADAQEAEANRKLTANDFQTIRELRHKALKASGRSECPPYYAILAADGDRMGSLLKALKIEQSHIEISNALSAFAQEAAEMVRKFDGHAVYTGGDDVLALLPANRALACAAELAALFRSKMQAAVKPHGLTLAAPKQGGTLSVGIAIAHCLEPLQVSLEHARAAERDAKIERNSLSVRLHTRGGEPMTVTETWSETPDVTEWESLVDAMRGELARGFPYELRTLARECQGADLSPDVMRWEALRILDRKKGGKAEATEQFAPLRRKLKLPSEPTTADEMPGNAQAQVAQAQLAPGQGSEQALPLETAAPLPNDSADGLIKNPCELECFAKKLVIARFLAELEPLTMKEDACVPGQP